MGAGRIEDYALLSSTRSAALVGLDGSIDWLCAPRFDSGAMFASLLGDEENGRWRIAPTAAPSQTRRRYLDGTLVLETVFDVEQGQVRLIDLMPLGDGGAHIVRIVEGVRGEVEMTMDLVIRFDGGERVPWVTKVDGGIIAVAGDDAVVVRSPVKMHGEDRRTRATFTVGPGERVPFTLSWFPSFDDPPRIEAEPELAATEERWREWSGRCTYDGPWREAVVRSLITLKALTYEPSGAIVAAPTHIAARGDRRRPQLGLPLLLATRRDLHPLCPGPRRLHRGGGRLAGLAAAGRGRRRQPDPGALRRRRRAADHRDRG